MQKCFQMEPQDRYTCDQLLKHDYFDSYPDFEEDSQAPERPNKQTRRRDKIVAPKDRRVDPAVKSKIITGGVFGHGLYPVKFVIY